MDWILPPLRGSDINSLPTVGYVRAYALTSPTAKFLSPLTGLKLGVLAGRMRHLWSLKKVLSGDL